MLWVIQRDFLQGKSVQQLVDDAITPWPNPQHDKAVEETNKSQSLELHRLVVCGDIMV